MDISWPNTVAESWFEIVSLTGSILFGLIAVFRGLFLFQQSNNIRRADLLKSLLDEYNGKTVTESVNIIEAGMNAGGHVTLIEPALLFFSNACYLRQQGLLNSREFAFFKWKIEHILADSFVYDYVKFRAEKDKASPFAYLLQYRRTSAT